MLVRKLGLQAQDELQAELREKAVLEEFIITTYPAFGRFTCHRCKEDSFAFCFMTKEEVEMMVCVKKAPCLKDGCAAMNDFIATPTLRPEPEEVVGPQELDFA